jgi:hypothetical protein
MQTMVRHSGQSNACPIALLNHLPQVPDSVIPDGALLACPVTQETVEKGAKTAMPATQNDWSERKINSLS